MYIHMFSSHVFFCFISFIGTFAYGRAPIFPLRKLEHCIGVCIRVRVKKYFLRIPNGTCKLMQNTFRLL